MSDKKIVFSGESIGNDPEFIQMLMDFRGDYFNENDFPELISHIDSRDRATLRDHFSENAPITLKDALVVHGLEGSQIRWLSQEKRMEVFALLAQLRLEYADAMIAERAK